MLELIAQHPLAAVIVAAAIGAAAMELWHYGHRPCEEAEAYGIIIELEGKNARLKHDNRALRAQMAVTDGDEEAVA